MKWTADLRYALRLLLKSPGFSVLTAGVMAVGLGISLYMLAFLDVTVLRPLPFDRGEDMYVIETEVNGLRLSGGSINHYDAELLLETLDSFDLLGLMNSTSVNVSSGDRAVRVSALYAAANLFPFLSITPAQGRAFTPGEASPGAAPVAIIGHELWQNQFAGQPDTVGRRIKVAGRDTEIIGIMPAGFYFPTAQQIWLPLTERAADRGDRTQALSVSVFGLKKPEVSLDEANMEIQALFAGLATEHPNTNANTTASAQTFQLDLMGEGSVMILSLMSLAVLSVLLLSCINVGNLLLARASERARETAIRVALGAPRGRLIMQMMWESVIICAIGGTLGILLAGQGWEFTQAYFPRMMPVPPPFYWLQSFDLALVGKAILIIVVTAVVTGIIPSLRLAQGDFNAVLRDGTRGAVGRRANRVTRALVVLEVALSAALLIVAAVLVIILEQLQNKDYGVRSDGLLTARIGLPADDYPDGEDRADYYRQLLDGAVRIPGVSQVGLISALPGTFAGRWPTQAESVDLGDAQPPRVGRAAFTPETFDLFEIPLVSGRKLSDFDRQDSPRVAVVDTRVAERLWPDQDPLGQRFQWADNPDDAWITVVGVVGKVTHGQPYALIGDVGTIYEPYDQVRFGAMSLVLDAAGAPDRLREPLVNLAARLDHEVPVYAVQTLEEGLAAGIGGMKLVRSLFLLFALAALVLAASGIYGVLSNITQRRTHEIGVRRALGAPDPGVLLLLMRQGWWQLAIGLLVGVPLGYFMSAGFVRLIGPEGTAHWWALLWVPLTITAVVTVATWVPARRAIRLEPAAALHYE